MTPREAFKIGFLSRFAELGMPGAEIEKCAAAAVALLEKQANPLAALMNTAPSTAASLAGTAGSIAVPLAVAAPLVIGGGLGIVAGKAQDSDVDPEDVKKQELIDEFRHQVRQMQERRDSKATRFI